MKMSISYKMVIVSVIGVILSSVIILFIGISMTVNIFTRALRDEMSAVQSIFSWIQEQEEERLWYIIQNLSTAPELLETVYADDVEKIMDFAQISLQQINNSTLTTANSEIIRILVITVSCAIGVMFIIAVTAGLTGRQITKSIKKVIDYALQVANGDFNAALSVDSKDEVGQLADAFKNTVLSLKKSLYKEEVFNKIIRKDLEVKKDLLLKLKLMLKAAKIGLWDMDVVQEDPVNPMNTFIWSDEFRYMLGYSNETDFPNVLGSWIDCIHPDEREKILNKLKNHLDDTTGTTPYDVEYRMIKKNGDIVYFRDSGETIRDKKGTPLRASGALMEVPKENKSKAGKHSINALMHAGQ